MKKNNIITYKGFHGSINFDQEEKLFYGQIEFIKDFVNYEAKDADGLINSFQEAVDDYLSTCKQLSKYPDKPFKGTFNVRIGTELHEKIGLYALQHDDTLNNVVKNALSKFVELNHIS
ncbi:type II toxin-antitoxin system HicB family antitoxin [Candidatus Bandiella numerosa]|uniref:type II toxin-antitoxin system HicB family antitoxin n=1 Tax=Candidatus Bandiella numerosa TaxID=2570586 RepID=UPI001F1E2AC6|nr:type II toxin-antitoxin system HicB family antitoxin [Candidatus Bandiella numerosa]